MENMDKQEQEQDLMCQREEVIRSLSQDVYKILFDYMITTTKNEVYLDSIVQKRIYERYSPMHLLCLKKIIAEFIDLIGKYCKDNGISIDDVNYDYKDLDDLGFMCYDYLVDMSNNYSCKLLYPIVLDKLYHGIEDFKDFKDYEDDDDPIPKFTKIFHDTIIQIVFEHFEWKYKLEPSNPDGILDGNPNDDELEEQKNTLDGDPDNNPDDNDNDLDFNCVIS